MFRQVILAHTDSHTRLLTVIILLGQVLLGTHTCTHIRTHATSTLTVIIMFRQVVFADEQIVVLVELPEFAVDDVEVFVREEIHYLVDVVLVVQQHQGLKTKPWFYSERVQNTLVARLLLVIKE